jgi:hypothetical protein
MRTGVLPKRRELGRLALRRDKPVDVVAVIALEICVLTPEKAGARRDRASPNLLLFGQVAHHSPSILSTKRQKSIVIFANQAIWGRSANIGLQ